MGKDEINLATDPPPDLIIEVDITNESLDPFPIFAAVGVPEVWHCDGNSVTLLRLEGAGYVRTPRSPSFPLLTAEVATRFLIESRQMTSTKWLRSLREWVRSQKG